MKRSAMVVLLAFLMSSMLWAQTTDTGKPRKVITDASIGGSNYTFYRDTVYVLDGYVYYEAPGTLTIQSGTVIKGVQDPSNGIDLGSCLVICKSAYIHAEGTPTQPIVFTSEYDSVALPDNGPDPGVDYTLDQGLWGGVILCGKATLNIAATAIIEGLPPGDARGEYGGADDNDSSGVFRYVSIRYSGVLVEANKELQSLTMGCVGSRTVVEYVESFNSADDGFEFFGGTCNTRYLASVFADDDAFDYDHGFRGNHQFWFALQARNKGDNIGEFDSGDVGALTNPPLSNPAMYNVTFIGRGDTATAGGNAVRYKEFAGGRIFNSIFADFQGTNNFNIDSGSGATCYNRLIDSVDQLVHQNNLWYKGAGYTAFNQFVSKNFQYTYLSNGGHANTIADPQFTNLTRVAGGGGDFRPLAGSPAYTLPRKALPADPWWTQADYYGAFGPSNNWIGGWTALSELGVVVDVKDNAVKVGGTPSDFVLRQNFPNPFNPNTTIRFDVRSDARVKLTVYNVLGQKVAVLVDGFKAAGAYEVQWNAADVASGVYFYRLESGDFKRTRKMLLIK